MRRGATLVVLVLGLAGLAACAKRVAPPLPEGEDYVFPASPPGELPASATPTLQAAWREVLAGDTASAARRYEKLLKRFPGSVAAQAGLGYARLRAGRADDAAAAFASVLERRPQEVPALVGAGSAAFRKGDLDGAVALYRQAAAAAPNDVLVRKRLAALKLQATDRGMADAQAALGRGDTDEAARAYARALEAAPEVAAVRLSLAELRAAGGDRPGAVALLEADPSGDRQVLLALGRMLCEESEFARASSVYRRLLALDPADEAARAGQLLAHEGLEALAMPEEYRQIREAARLTRADLAALVVVRVPALRRLGGGAPRVALDISGSWAREQVARVLALGVMEVYPNHTFQPGAIVRRVDLARAAARALDLLRWPRGASPAPTDMSPAHLDFGAVERVLGAGLMGLTPAGAFEPWRPVGGSEAIAVVDALSRLAGP